MPVTVTGTVQLDATLGAGLVELHPDPLRINVKSFRYDMGGNRGTFDGAVAESVADDDTSYVYLNAEGELVINTTGYPTEVSYLAIARVAAANGEVVGIYDERILLSSSSSVVGVCRIGFPIDAGIRGGNCLVSSNNDIGSITFAADGESRNRWNIRPPQNYTSGDPTLRLLCSVAGSPGSTGTRWKLQWGFLSIADSLPSSYPYSVELTKSMTGISNDVAFEIAFTIPAANFNTTKDMMYFWLARDGDHADDTCTLLVHCHLCELRYIGYKVAGQAGQ